MAFGGCVLLAAFLAWRNVSRDPSHPEHVKRGNRIGRENAAMRACEGNAVASKWRDGSANSAHGVFDGNHRTRRGAA